MTCIIIPSKRFANFIWTTIAFILLSTSPLVSSFSRNPFFVPQLEHTIHTTQIPLHLTEVKQLDLDLDTSVSTEPIADLLHDYQTVAQQITSSFSFQPFQPISTFPLSILSQNNHVQTIAGTLWRDKSACTYIPSKNFFPTGIWKFFLDPGNDTQNGLDWYDERKCISTPDHDFFHVDFKYQNRESRGTVIIVHGLESNSASPLVVDMARSFYDKGFDVACKFLKMTFSKSCMCHFGYFSSSHVWIVGIFVFAPYIWNRRRCEFSGLLRRSQSTAGCLSFGIHK